MPFLLVLTRQLEMSAFEACEEACSFIRVFGSKELPSTATRNVRLSLGGESISHLEPSNASEPLQLNLLERGFPLFVSVRNGHGLRAAAPALGLEALPAAMLFSVAEWSSVAVLGEGRALPSPRATAPSSCEELETRRHIHSAPGKVQGIDLHLDILTRTYIVYYNYIIMCICCICDNKRYHIDI